MVRIIKFLGTGLCVVSWAAGLGSIFPWLNPAELQEEIDICVTKVPLFFSCWHASFTDTSAALPSTILHAFPF